MLFVSFFFFNDTATTEIYTYGHTLSLHDSLPIFKPHLGKIQLQQLRPADVSSWLQKLVASGNLSTRSIRHAHGVLSTALRHAAAIEIVERSVARSEEHTSELQSLMRISYAVFCLKKKNNTRTTNEQQDVHN